MTHNQSEALDWSGWSSPPEDPHEALREAILSLSGALTGQSPLTDDAWQTLWDAEAVLVEQLTCDA